jgi:hypothetical protein
MIDATELMTVVDTVVEKRGEDWKYPNWKDVYEHLADEEERDNFWLPEGCHYFWAEDDVEAGKLLGLDLVRGEPACLVGAVLAELNLIDMITEEDNGNGVMSLDVLESALDYPVQTLLLVGQDSQDRGDTWGTARDKMRQRLADGPE